MRAGHQRILLVSSDTTRRRAVAAPLEEAGFELSHAGTTELGLALATVEAPDLVILDAGALEPNSPEAVHLMRTLPGMGSVPIFVLLPPNLEPKLAAGLLRGADVCMLSSVDPRMLRSRITVALAMRDHAQRARRRRASDRSGEMAAQAAPDAPRQCA